jgi:vanillate O-demethylase ferredoxin subunit
MKAGTYTVSVARKTVEALDICSFELVSADASTTLPAFSAGSHIDVHLPNGITRQYSLCNDSQENHRYLIGVLKDPSTRGGSRAMHESVDVGDTLQISAPKNHFALAHEAGSSLLLAGGIGITPILCMAERLANAGEDFQLHYCARTPDRMAFHDRIRRSAFSAKAWFHFDDGDVAQRLQLDTILTAPQPGTHLYVCGPKGFMNAVLEKARAAGWPESRLHYEFFAAEVVKSESDETFEVQIASSGKVVRVGKDVTVTQALASAGIEVPTSCEQGVCGTCLTRVIEGRPDHRDMYLSPDEQEANDQFLPCCSRSKSARLILDL